MSTATRTATTDSVPAVIAFTDGSTTTGTTASPTIPADTSASIGDDPEVIPPPAKKRRIKSHFVSITKVDDKGTPLFLADTNLKDLHLLRALVLKLPWAAGFGNMEEAWNTVANTCEEQRGEGDSVIFAAGSLQGKAVRERFKVLVKWIRDDTKASMYRSGTDNEAPPNEIVQLMCEMSELYLEWEENKETSTKKKADERKQNREQAATIRDASLGGRSYDTLKTDDENNSKKGKDGNNSFNLNGLMELASSQLSNTPQKMDLVERKVKLSEEKLKFEERKFDLEIDERKFELEERKERMAQEKRRSDQTFDMINNQMKMQKEMMEMLMKKNS